MFFPMIGEAPAMSVFQESTWESWPIFSSTALQFPQKLQQNSMGIWFIGLRAMHHWNFVYLCYFLDWGVFWVESHSDMNSHGFPLRWPLLCRVWYGVSRGEGDEFPPKEKWSLCPTSCISFVSYSGHTKLSIFYHFAKPDFLEDHIKKSTMPHHIPCTTTLITVLQ